MSSVSRDSELSTCTTVYPVYCLIVCSCTFHVEMNNCSDPHHLSLLPAQRLAGNISFPSPSTAAGELLLPVNTSPITTPRCQTLCLTLRQMTICFSFPPSFCIPVENSPGEDDFLSSLGLQELLEENYCWHKSTEPRTSLCL